MKARGALRGRRTHWPISVLSSVDLTLTSGSNFVTNPSQKCSAGPKYKSPTAKLVVVRLRSGPSFGGEIACPATSESAKMAPAVIDLVAIGFATSDAA